MPPPSAPLPAALPAPQPGAPSQPSEGPRRPGRAGPGRAALAMLPSALYWDLVGSSALLNLPAAPGFGSLGKSFLIENLLRAGAPQSPAQLRPLPASPVPLKLCPAAEQISPSGGPYPTRWAFQVLNPSAADGGRLPARAPAADRGGVFPPAATGERRPRGTGTGSGRGGRAAVGLSPSAALNFAEPRTCGWSERGGASLLVAGMAGSALHRSSVRPEAVREPRARCRGKPSGTAALSAGEGRAETILRSEVYFLMRHVCFA